MGEKRETTESRRARGRAKMAEVYNFPPGYPPEPLDEYMALSVEHLFGEIWSRPGLSIRDRRLITIGIVSMLNDQDIMRLQLRSALDKSELTIDQVRELVVHVAYYAGVPRGTVANRAAKRVIEEYQKDNAGASPSDESVE
jgi:4-carboxymuconolactone decarboxylase